jgi:hypothetical protein
MKNIQAFHSAREAKEFLVSRIVEEAQSAGAALSEVERKMLYFSETGWTLPEMDRISEEFDESYDQGKYERRVANLIKRAYKHAMRTSEREYEDWWAAIRLLSKQDHYLSVMIRLAGLRPRWDRLKLFGASVSAAILLVSVIFIRIYLESRYGVNFSKYIPSRDTRDFLFWAFLASAVIIYCLLRWLLGARRVDDFVAKSLARLGRTFN